MMLPSARDILGKVPVGTLSAIALVV
jgi:hypothetical protein